MALPSHDVVPPGAPFPADFSIPLDAVEPSSQPMGSEPVPSDSHAAVTCEVLKRELQELRVSLQQGIRMEFRSIVEEASTRRDTLRNLAFGGEAPGWQLPKADGFQVHQFGKPAAQQVKTPSNGPPALSDEAPDGEDEIAGITTSAKSVGILRRPSRETGRHIVGDTDTDGCAGSMLTRADTLVSTAFVDDMEMRNTPTMNASPSRGLKRTLVWSDRSSQAGKSSSPSRLSEESGKSSSSRRKGERMSKITTLNERVEKLTWGNIGEFCIAFAIIVNGVCFGAQTDYMARKKQEEVPAFFAAAELCFCVIFSTELAVKLWYFRRELYRGPGWQWNVFDTILVVIQLSDVLLEIILKGSSGVLENASFLRLLRVLRLLRIMRLVRLMKFFEDLNIVTSAIANSMRPLFGTVMLMGLMMYIIGIAFTLFATTKRMEDDNPELTNYFGSLSRSILSLYEAILGGVDWDNLVVPLLDISWVLGILFAVYIAFALLAMLNVITGIFVESALKNAAKETERTFQDQVRAIYAMTDSDHDGNVTREEFEIGICSRSFQEYMKSINIEPEEAKLLFEFLDSENSGQIDGEQLLSGLIRLRSGAKCIDVMSLMHDFSEHCTLFESWSRAVDGTVHDINKTLRELSERGILPVGKQRPTIEKSATDPPDRTMERLQSCP